MGHVVDNSTPSIRAGITSSRVIEEYYLESAAKIVQSAVEVLFALPHALVISFSSAKLGTSDLLANANHFLPTRALREEHARGPRS
jgi:hypothetical protein